MPSIAITPEVEDLARKGAWFVYSVSGGKDSGASMHAVDAWLDVMGHPRGRRLALHADLGRAEWTDTLDTVRRICARIGVDLEVVSQKNDLAWRFEDRWRRSLLRYQAMETINVVPPWSSSSLLYCRSEQKLVPLSSRKAKIRTDLPVVGIVGIRREESSRRAHAPISQVDGEMRRRNGRDGILWHPIADWKMQDVFDYHQKNEIPLHRAYALGSSRLSCALCVLASKNDLMVSITKGKNHDILREYTSLEIRSGFSFQSNAWLCDLAPEGMIDHKRLSEAKSIAEERNAAQALIPRDILRTKSIGNIEEDDAELLAGVRRRILDLYGLKPYGVTADEIMRLSRGELIDA